MNIRSILFEIVLLVQLSYPSVLAQTALVFQMNLGNNIDEANLGEPRHNSLLERRYKS